MQFYKKHHHGATIIDLPLSGPRVRSDTLHVKVSDAKQETIAQMPS